MSGRIDRRRGLPWRATVLLVAGLYFGLPLYAGLRFAFEDNRGRFSVDAFTSIPSQQGFTEALDLSLRLTAVTLAVTLGLMVPTAIFVHLRARAYRRVLDGVTLLPIAIPPVVLIVGVLQVDPTWLKSSPYLLSLEYVVLAMPFAYRALDAGLAAMDLRTLFDASQSLGAGWMATLWRVVLPNLRASLLSATVLTVAAVLGEYTMASLDQYQTVPVWITFFSQDDSHVSTAVSILSMFLTWLLLVAISLVAGRRRQPAVAAGAVSLPAAKEPLSPIGAAA